MSRQQRAWKKGPEVGGEPAAETAGPPVGMVVGLPVEEEEEGVCGLGRGGGALVSEPSVVGWAGGRGCTLPLSLTTGPLLPQKVTVAAETKIHPWKRTLMNHMPKWEVGSPVRGVHSIQHFRL